MDLLWKDIRFGLRTLWRNPATTVVALLALALGIGANTAIFSVVSGVLLEPLPYPGADRLMLVWEKNPELSFPRFPVAPSTFFDWRHQTRTFEGLAATRRAQLNLTGRDQPEVLSGARVSAGFFRLMRAEPSPGRDFLPEEDRPGAGHVAVLSRSLWQRLFASDPNVVGRTLQLDGEPYTIVGVAPAWLALPRNTDLWVPIAMDPAQVDRGGHSLIVVGRLRPGVSQEQAGAEMSAIAARLAQQYPETNRGWGTVLVSLRESIVADIRPVLLILLGAVSLVLLIACANVANLLLARVAAREREIAVRTALGAGRWRLIRQMLTESTVLFVGGGALGLLLAFWGTRLLIAMDPDGIPRSQGIGIDHRVLLFTFGVSLATGLLFGLVPALHATGGPLQPALKEGGRALAGGLRGRWLRSSLVLVEVGLALVLLVGAGLLLQSFARLQGVDPGFEAGGLLTGSISLPANQYREPAQQVAFFRQALERLAATPGVKGAASVYPLPMSGQMMMLAFFVEGRPLPATLTDLPAADIWVVSPGYFQLMGIPRVTGRDFTGKDSERSQPVAIVNDVLAKRIWPGESPLGKRLTFDDPRDPNKHWLTVVGVVESVHGRDLGEPPGMQAYWPQLQAPIDSGNLLVRADNPSSLTGPLRQVVSSIDRNLPVDQVRPLDDVLSQALARSRFKAVLLALFAGLALVLAAVGVYGVISYSVAQRTHEIGIRMALGAHRGQVLRMVVRQGMGLVFLGVIAGLAGAWFAVRLLTDQVFGVEPSDPATFTVVPLVLLAVAFFANYLPARRATAVDPLEALRYE